METVEIQFWDPRGVHMFEETTKDHEPACHRGPSRNSFRVEKQARRQRSQEEAPRLGLERGPGRGGLTVGILQAACSESALLPWSRNP